jgi:hypothetical protein
MGKNQKVKRTIYYHLHLHRYYLLRLQKVGIFGKDLACPSYLYTCLETGNNGLLGAIKEVKLKASKAHKMNFLLSLD